MYEDKELFGKIEYFIVHEFREKLHILAYIQWTSECTYRQYKIIDNDDLMI